MARISGRGARGLLTLAALAGIGIAWLAVAERRPERAGPAVHIHEFASSAGNDDPGRAAPPRIASRALPEPAPLQAVPPPVVLAAEASETALLPVPLELERASAVTRLLQPLSTLAGAVLDGEGAGLAGLPVHWRRGRALERSTSTDAFGAFQIEELVRGAGELVLGDARSPILPPRALELVAGLVDLGSIAVPRLGELMLRVVDENDAPVAGASLSGSGHQGGSIDARSDLDGLARAPFLPPGMYRVFATHPALGRGNTVFEFAPGKPSSVEVRLRRAAPRG